MYLDYNKKLSKSTKKSKEFELLRGPQPRKFLSQKNAIFKLLRDSRGRWVPAYRLSRIALQYSSRVSELRRSGCLIANRTERVGGKVYGSFRLVSMPRQPGRSIS
jgi:hypothetical protein